MHMEQAVINWKEFYAENEVVSIHDTEIEQPLVLQKHVSYQFSVLDIVGFRVSNK